MHTVVSHIILQAISSALSKAVALGNTFPIHLYSHIKEVNEKICLSSRQVANLTYGNKLSERRLQIISHTPLPPSKTSSDWSILQERARLYQLLQSILKTHCVKTAITRLAVDISRALAAQHSAQQAEMVQTLHQPRSSGSMPGGSHSGIGLLRVSAQSCRPLLGLGGAGGSSSSRQEPAEPVTGAEHTCRCHLHSIFLSMVTAAPNWLQ